MPLKKYHVILLLLTIVALTWSLRAPPTCQNTIYLSIYISISHTNQKVTRSPMDIPELDQRRNICSNLSSVCCLVRWSTSKSSLRYKTVSFCCHLSSSLGGKNGVLCKRKEKWQRLFSSCQKPHIETYEGVVLMQSTVEGKFIWSWNWS